MRFKVEGLQVEKVFCIRNKTRRQSGHDCLRPYMKFPTRSKSKSSTASNVECKRRVPRLNCPSSVGRGVRSLVWRIVESLCCSRKQTHAKNTLECSRDLLILKVKNWGERSAGVLAQQCCENSDHTRNMLRVIRCRVTALLKFTGVYAPSRNTRVHDIHIAVLLSVK